MSRLRRSCPLIALAIVTALPSSAGAARFEGTLTSDAGPVAGAMLTFTHGQPAHSVTVFSDEAGRFASPPLSPGDYVVRARRIGYRDLRREGVRLAADAPSELVLNVERETDPAALAAQLPANEWFARVLTRIEDDDQREEFVRQCTFCHQQGSRATRIVREPEEWEKIINLMGRMGGMVSEDLRDALPELLNAAYDPETAVPALTHGMGEPDFAPPPPPGVRRAVIEEWELGHRAAMQHDVAMHPDGRLYSVDMSFDKLYRLDPAQPDGGREWFDVPRDGLPLGGVFGTKSNPMPSNTEPHVGPHSIQVAPDGSLWITLALGNRLARFDPATETWEIHRQDGFYPHTLRFDQEGRIWYTLAASNHLAMFDPESDEQRMVRLPAESFGQSLVLRMLPAAIWLSRHVDISGVATSGDPPSMPVPYGVDVAPDGSVWFSQLNAHRIGRVDPESFEVEVIDTPFTGPRRLRFDSRGRLWIPAFSQGLISRFDPATREFRSWPLPTRPAGSDVPYALNVDRRSDTVWICGTNSDTLLRFEPESERFTVYPLPTRVTYTREIDFDAQGRIWTSNSNVPSWQIEGGYPRVLRLDPGDGVRLAAGEGR